VGEKKGGEIKGIRLTSTREEEKEEISRQSSR